MSVLINETLALCVVKMSNNPTFVCEMDALTSPLPGDGTGTVSLVRDKLQEAKSETLFYLCSVKSMQVKLS